MTPEEISQIHVDATSLIPFLWTAKNATRKQVIRLCENTEQVLVAALSAIDNRNAEVLRLTEERAALAEELTRVRKTSAQALEAMDDYVTSYPHMDKGYMADARYELRAALSHTGMAGATK